MPISGAAKIAMSRRSGACCTFVLGLLLGLCGVQAEDAVSEYSIKAVFLYNFARFTEWPDSAFRASDSPVSVCILGQDPFADELDQIKDRTVHGRKLLLKRPRKTAGVEQCHVLFVSASEEKRLSQILDQVESSPVLTVGDMEGFAKAGGAINFTKIGKRIRFDINPTTTKASGITLSSKLLSLARLVGEEAQTSRLGEGY